MDILPFSPDQFGGIIVEPNTLPESPDAFREALGLSLERTGKQTGSRLVWLDVPIGAPR